MPFQHLLPPPADGYRPRYPTRPPSPTTTSSETAEPPNASLPTRSHSWKPQRKPQRSKEKVGERLARHNVLPVAFRYATPVRLKLMRMHMHIRIRFDVLGCWQSPYYEG